MLGSWKRSLAGAALAASFLVPQLHGQDLAKETSLGVVPQDAAFYGATLRQRETLEQLWNSKAVQKIRLIPHINGWYEKALGEWEEGSGQFGQAKQVLENPSVVRVLEFLVDAGSQEAFFFGDKNWVKFMTEYEAIGKEIVALQAEGASPEALQEYLLGFDKERFDRLPVPGTLAGFKITDKDRAIELLDQLQGAIFAAKQAEQVAPFFKKVDRQDKGDDSLIVWTLDADSIPWDEIPVQEEEQEEMIEKVQELLEGRKIVITIGVKGDYFIFSVSDSKDLVAGLGTGDTLITHKNLKPLLDADPDKLNSVSYLSDEFALANWKLTFENYFQKSFGSVLGSVKQMVALSESLDQAALEEEEEDEEESDEEESEEEESEDEEDEDEEEGDDDEDASDKLAMLDELLASVPSDLKWLDEKIGALVPEQKGMLAFSYATSKGYAGKVIYRTETVSLDGSKPLEMLQHVGGSPLMMTVSRGAYHPEYFELVSEIAQKVKGYLVKLSESDLLEEEQKAGLSLALDRVFPLLEKASKIVRTELVPGTKDGQVGLVLNSTMKSKQWVKDMPVSEDPLPLPEFALLVGVSDREQVLRGLDQLLGTLDELVGLAKQLAPNEIPADYTIPRPESKEIGDATSYFYPIPDDCPVPKELTPQVVLGNHLMIENYSETQLKALLPESPLKVGGSLIKQDDKLANASYVNFNALIKTFKPWVEYAITLENDLEDEIIPGEGDVPPMVAGDILTIWDAWAEVGEVVSVTKVEDGQAVTTWEWNVGQ